MSTETIVDCDEHGVWVCSFCRLRLMECPCTDETPWAQNRMVRKMEWFLYNNPIPEPRLASFINWGA